ncbi:MAG: transposase [Parcubacteria group bacterium]|nr:transposase [Parcubacteria group bacterium]
MRVQPFTVGSYVHVYNRGHRKSEIVLDEKDKWRFMQGLRFFNDVNLSQNILRDILKDQDKDKDSKSLLVSDTNRLFESVFELGWPKNWPEKKPLVKILCYCLVPNHFHLLLEEIVEGGISKFMQKLGIGFTNYFNLIHREEGRLFQGSYKGKTVGDDQIYLEYLSVYIQVINVLELFPGGFKKALEDIDKALEFVEQYQFSSYQDFIGLRESLIIDKDILGEIFLTPEHYKKFVRDILMARTVRKYEEVLEYLVIE